ncbi:SsrA-binding protein SmpB [bacterium]|nr:SsrA-binding protein SmpB [bacterium]
MAEETRKKIARNKKIFRLYEILDRYEAGIELVGTEIKSIREGEVSFRDSYIEIQNGEAYLVGFFIAQYTAGNIWNHDDSRRRKLLLHRREILKWDSKIRERGFTIVPIELYLRNGKAKIEIGLARGKTGYNRKHDIKQKDMQRDLARDLKQYR